MKNRGHTLYGQKRVFTCLLILFALLLLVGVNKNMGQGENTQRLFPLGNWSVGMHPYLGPGYDSIPVMVTGVTTDARRGIGVTKVSLDNQSGKNVKAVRLSWYLTIEGNPTSILLQGQTPLITRDGTFPAGSHLTIRYPVLAFASIYKPLVKNGALNGEFRIDILVSEILYEDGSTWTRAESSQAKFIKVTSHAPRPVPQGTCPKQACDSKESPSGRVYYGCKASNFNETCANSPDAFSCTNVSCGSTRPSSEDEGFAMIQM